MKTIVCCLLLSVSSGLVWAGGALQGTVRDSRGDPIKGAEIRIEGRDGNVLKIIKTDVKGHYFSDNLAIGTDYRLTLVVNGSIKASLLNVSPGAGKPADLNFDLRQAKGTSKNHMVWVPTETGTHIGAANGHWVEVDENGHVINNANQDVVRTDSNYAKQLENSKSNSAVGK